MVQIVALLHSVILLNSLGLSFPTYHIGMVQVFTSWGAEHSKKSEPMVPLTLSHLAYADTTKYTFLPNVFCISSECLKQELFPRRLKSSVLKLLIALGIKPSLLSIFLVSDMTVLEDQVSQFAFLSLARDYEAWENERHWTAIPVYACGRDSSLRQSPNLALCLSC